MRFVAYGDRKRVAAALRPIHAAVNEQAAASALADFADSPLGREYPTTAAAFKSAWDKHAPFLAFGPALRRGVYTTNATRIAELPVTQSHKKSRAFPQRRSSRGLLRPAICTIEDKRARQREKDAGNSRRQRRSKKRLIQGRTTTNWKQALAQLTTACPEQITPYP